MGKLISSIRYRWFITDNKLKGIVCSYLCSFSFNHLPLFGRVNVSMGVKEDRMMMTGIHTVVDIFCVGCGSIVGWKYEIAHEKSQKYKEGKSVLERFKVSGPDGSSYWMNHEVHIGGSDADDV
ncbi:protein yippee-like isoform X2 [Jatropha curcas]|uniref:protein yippee-like isoform X2 n=1 Tax=Jatropha curcas TaxID=180498 RepID=UPI001893E48D|nr:protein yippee-like isoform X2 [Jatropha curcas]